MNQKIKNALISISDKEGLKNILKILKKYNINIVSSGGTYKTIKNLGYKCSEVSSYTGFNEMLDGRVKTLHPKVHAGILFDRSNKRHLKQMVNQNFQPIDLVIVNFYPFQKVVAKSKNTKKIIENIDIGGPTMVRAAAKNFKSVVIITNKSDYSLFTKEIIKNKGATTLKFREYMSAKAFSSTAYYDSIVSNWFNNLNKIEFPETKTYFGKKISELRYGENPHQKASLYFCGHDENKLGLKTLNGKELSYNNYNDIFSSLEILFSIKKVPTTVIIKHANPCGVSSNKEALKSFINAFASDPVSAFGGVIACNYKINKKIAQEINKNFVEVILAKGFEKRALQILKKKKNLRVIDITNYSNNYKTSVKNLGNFLLAQNKDEIIYNKKDLKCVTKIKPTKAELKEIEFAYNICKYVKSNSIVLTKNLSTIGIGAGQPSRLDSCKIATQKAFTFRKEHIKNCVAASDAFFPFADGIKTLIAAGVGVIVQPGGSIRDKEVIEAANKAKIKMIFTKTRHFNH